MNHRLFFELSPDLLCAVDQEGRFLDANPAWERTLGFKPADLNGRLVIDFVDPLDKETTAAALSRALDRAVDSGRGTSMRPRQREGSLHARFSHKDGSIRWLAWSFALAPDDGAIVASVRDVTEQRADQRHFFTMLQATPDFVAITGLDGEVLYINPSGLDLIGRTGQGAEALRRRELIPASIRAHAAQIRDAVVREGSWSGESALEDANGTLIPVSQVTALIRDEDGNPAALGTIARDLRARKRDEAHVRKLRTLMSSTSDLIALLTLDGDVTYMNPAGLTMLGRRASGGPAMRFTDFLRDEGSRSFQGSIRPTVMRDGLWAGEVSLSRESGASIPISMVVILIKNETGDAEAIGVIARDLTENKAMEAALKQAIRAMSTPIIQVWEGVLALPVIGVVDAQRAAQMMESLLEAIVRTRCHVAILDLTGVDVVDTATVNHLFQMVSAASLLGSACLVSGISPQVAQTVASLGVDLTTLRAFGTLQEALRVAMGLAGGGPRPLGR